MKSNYDILGNHIRLIDTRNRESITDRVLGINIDKFFMPSVANVIGTDLSKYKLITKGKFACNPMHVVMLEYNHRHEMSNKLYL